MGSCLRPSKIATKVGEETVNNKEILTVLIAVEVATIVSIAFNILFARQILCFLFLTFVPGFMLFRLLNSGNIGILKTGLYSVGLSLVFLMFAGLLLNMLPPVLGYVNPLSTTTVTFFIIAVTLVLTAAVLLQKEKEPTTSAKRHTFKVTPVVAFFIALPFITILGAELADIFNSTIVLMVVTALIAILVFAIFSRRMLPQTSYPLVLFSIAFFLLIGTSLISNYVVGTDVQTETYYAQLTSVTSRWNPTIQQPYNGMLSVTILPTVMSKIMAFDIPWIFKVVYPVIFTSVPVALYLAYRKQTNAAIAFLAVFFFMSMDTFFLQMLGLARQMIAEVFFGLLILLLVDKSLDISKRRILFFVFGAGLIVSHYSLGYILVFYMLLALLLARFFKSPGDKSKPDVTVAIAGGLIGLTLVWDLLVTPSAFQSLQTFVAYVVEQVQSHAPSPGISGLMPVYLSPLHDVSKYLFLFVQGLIVVGFVGLLVRRKTSGFNREYAAMSVASFIILLLTLLVPSFGSAGLNVTRFYHVTLFFLAPLCIIGPIFVLSVAAKIKNRISPPKQPERTISKTLKKWWLFAVTVVLVLFFLFQVGFVYEATSDSTPSSLALSKNRMQDWTLYLNELYIEPEEISAAQWIATHYDPKRAVFGDFGAKYLTSYGPIAYENYHLLDPGLKSWLTSDNYFYFGAWNLQHGKVEGMTEEWDMSDFAFVHNDTSKIYSNGLAEIYYGK
jgi:uncharacterized membrane protein